ncbi:cadherin-like beta sandwich domain-containing protein [Paenibacillus sp. BSR1-1]|uniref:cadherin-like beta sandwich domain-containing protein n=1 Tax=Paenibacillus sp. BSR1-1 TaxID=3020845 RepID=UPI0025AF2C30|nr:cadherin-like beta sandwich domain-containing protein [Paenibacillus sp. BSR1-1]MDN3015014.1 cadherin-like beta sandwich domain-containing protein [Paenibacillus sp. BSR1-1]
MLKMIQKKGFHAMLAVSLVSLGTVSYIPTASAESIAKVEASSLSMLELKGIALDKDFSAEIYEYTATVANDVKTITLHAESADPASSISINGKALAEGNVADFNLQTGKNTFTITVNDGVHTTKTYTVTVTREQNDNNLLKDIKLSTGKLSPAFSPMTTDYNIDVTNAISGITVTASAIESTSVISLNGAAMNEAGIHIELPVGKTDIPIVVTAENGDQRTYTIHVTKASAPISQMNASQMNASVQNNRSSSFQPSLQQVSNRSGTVQKTTKAKLSALSVSTGTWDSTFSSDEFTYHIAVASDVKTVTINSTAAYSSSSIKIEGGTNKTIQLEDDNRTIISVVVSHDDDDRKTYVLVFDKEK